MKLDILKNQTSVLIGIFIQDSSSTTGAGLTGLTSGSSGLVCYRARADDGNAAATQIALTGGTRGTWSSGGFIEKDATNMPGVYELGLPNTAVASGSNWVIVMLKGATNMAPLVLEIQLVAYDPEDAIHLGLSSLPNTAVTTNGSLITSGSGTAQLSVSGGVAQADLAKILTVAVSTSTAQLGVNVVNIKGSASAGAAGYVGLDWGNITAPTTAVNFSGSTIKTITDRVTANTDQLAGQTVTAAAGVTFPSSVASPTNITAGTITTVTNLTNVSAGGIVASSFASGALDAVWSTTARILTAGTNIVLPSNGLSSISAWTVAITGNITGNLSGSVGSVVSGVTLAVGAVQAIWDALTSALTTVGSIGKLLVTNIDTTISSRLASGSYTAPPTAAANADAVWDEILASHVTAGSTGQALSTASGGGTSGPNVNVVTWLGDTPQSLIGGRVQVVTMPPAQKWTG